mmetsp:Transcript_44680/g.97288  ORF Transcript_44680/g.97288 Transcript_44680/m.97288 type:complete len:281 (+) Transcript_44680:953-1795(+)|eukprot:6198626-Pleurochrysis_carterae.AAC.1
MALTDGHAVRRKHLDAMQAAVHAREREHVALHAAAPAVDVGAALEQVERELRLCARRRVGRRAGTAVAVARMQHGGQAAADSVDGRAPCDQEAHDLLVAHLARDRHRTVLLGAVRRFGAAGHLVDVGAAVEKESHRVHVARSTRTHEGGGAAQPRPITRQARSYVVQCGALGEEEANALFVGGAARHDEAARAVVRGRACRGLRFEQQLQTARVAAPGSPPCSGRAVLRGARIHVCSVPQQMDKTLMSAYARCEREWPPPTPPFTLNTSSATEKLNDDIR